MSSAAVASQHVKRLTADEVKVLSALADSLSRFQAMPKETLSDVVSLTPSYVDTILGRLAERKMVTLVGEPYEGVVLRTVGLDALALFTLAKTDVAVEFDGQIGVGKEADIYEALDANGEKVSLKFYRIGRTSFQDVLRRRRYVEPGENVPWLERSKKAAEREYKALNLLFKQDVSVPEPIDRRHHVVVMEYLDGEIISEAKTVLNPDLVFEECLDAVREAYQAGYVNGDLSAYNVFVTRDGRVLLIDWPQWKRRGEESASDSLEKDVRELTEYFESKFGLDVDYEEELRRVRS